VSGETGAALVDLVAAIIERLQGAPPLIDVFLEGIAPMPPPVPAAGSSGGGSVSAAIPPAEETDYILSGGTQAFLLLDVLLPFIGLPTAAGERAREAFLLLAEAAPAWLLKYTLVERNLSVRLVGCPQTPTLPSRDGRAFPCHDAPELSPHTR